MIEDLYIAPYKENTDEIGSGVRCQSISRVSALIYRGIDIEI
jgi:hypothetical protein